MQVLSHRVKTRRVVIEKDVGVMTMVNGAVVLDAQTQNGDEPVGEITYPRAKLPF